MMYYNIIKILIILILINNLIVINSNNINNSDELYKKALDYLHNNDYYKCIELLHQLIEIQPNNIEFNQLLGSLYISIGNNINELNNENKEIKENKENNKNLLNGVKYLEKALNLDNYKSSSIISNYIEGLRSIRNYKEAIKIGEKGYKLFNNDINIVYNLATIYNNINDLKNAQKYYLISIHQIPNRIETWKKLIDIMITRKLFNEALNLLDQYLYNNNNNNNNLLNNNVDLLFLKALCLHSDNKLHSSLEYYHRVIELDKNNYMAKANLGAVYQSLGLVNESLFYYEQVMDNFQYNAGILNNFGALLGSMGRKDDELYYLNKSYSIDPTLEHTLMNLGSYYQDDGDPDTATFYFEQAKLFSSSSPTLIDLRISLLLSPVTSSWKRNLIERNKIETKIINLLELSNQCKLNPHNCSIQKAYLDSSLDRVHFYLVYHGLNDKYMQELIVECYRRVLNDFGYINKLIPSSIEEWQNNIKLKYLNINNNNNNNNNEMNNKKNRKPGILQLQTNNNNNNNNLQNMENKQNNINNIKLVRIGFISKFFGIFEPHGLLLDGIMKYLPKKYFKVILLEVARTDGKPLPISLATSVDETLTIPLNHEAAINIIINLNLDILIFADVMCEPMNHFLAHSRLAPIQMAFWGNPVTSSSTSIDYFISADIMEHPFRTRIPIQDEPYTEQVILLEGQGIWYFLPLTAKEEIELANFKIDGLIVSDIKFQKSDFNLQNDWFIYFCPQSVFKIHPLFDYVLNDILLGDNNAHIVLTGGRSKRWDNIYINRLYKNINSNLHNRLHIIERVSSEKFQNLLNIADVLLHPFPFDGSKTSADGLQNFIPIVTLPTEYLRGRMGQAFLRTMNIPELVAINRDDYVKKSLALLKNNTLYKEIKNKLINRIHLIWEDMEYAYSWTNFLLKVTGIRNNYTWEEYILQSGRDLNKETILRDIRRKNIELFKKQYGNENWLLENGIARLETMLPLNNINNNEIDNNINNENENNLLLPIPKIFNNWKNNYNNKYYLKFDEYKKNIYNNIMKYPYYTTKLNNIKVKENIIINNNNNNNNNTISNNLNFNKSLIITTPIPNNIYEKYKIACINGKINDGFTILIKLYDLYNQHPHYLMDLGLTEFFRGNYQNAFDYCKLSHKYLMLWNKNNNSNINIISDQSINYYESGIILSCLGLSATYLNLTIGLDYILKAWEYANLYNSDILFSDIFGLPVEALNLNLVSAYRNSGQYKLCWDVSSISYRRNILSNNINIINNQKQENNENILKIINNITEYNGYLLVFSFINWSNKHYDQLQLLGETLITLSDNNIIQLSKYWFIEEIKRIQFEYTHIMNVVIDCFMQTHKELLTKIIYQMVNIIHNFSYNSLPFQPFMDINSEDIEFEPIINNCIENNIVLITQYFNANDSGIIHGMNTALLKNLYNPCIKDIYMLTEKEIDFSLFPPISYYNNHFKLKQVVIGKRLTFYDAIKFSNIHLNGRIVIIGII